jgi:hypothetical protein
MSAGSLKELSRCSLQTHAWRPRPAGGADLGRRICGWRVAADLQAVVGGAGGWRIGGSAALRLGTGNC